MVRTPDVVNRDDVGMIQIGDGAGLREISLGIFGVRDQRGVRHLDRHTAVQLIIMGQINQSEAPFS